MNLRGTLGMIALAVGMLLICSVPASAKSKKQICIDFGTAEYLFVGKIPGKNKCASFDVVDSFANFPPGYLANGSACGSGDGSSILFTISDGYFSQPETIQGTFATSTASGPCKDCLGTSCTSATCSLAFCSGQTIPEAVFDPASVLSRRSSTSGD